MLPYILHSSILLGGTFLLYWLLLRNETFFRLNRWVLLGSVILSLTLPLITMPAGWSLQTKISSLNSVTERSRSASSNSNLPSKRVQGQTLPVEIIASTTLDLNNKESGKKTAPALPTTNNEQFSNSTPEQISTSTTPHLNNSTILWYIYLTGVAIFSLAFVVQLGILLYRIIKYPAIKDGKYRIVELDDDQAPYSFLNCIFINPSRYEFDTYTQIIAHEKIHIEQIHFFDKFIAEGIVIAFWFNPFVWLYRNAITNNLEFLTDERMLDQGTEKESYQLSLLKVSVPHRPLNLTTNYNQSFLKNRIAMMNTKKSSAASSWKYLTLIPVIALSLVTLNAVNTEAGSISSFNSALELNTDESDLLEVQIQGPDRTSTTEEQTNESVENINGIDITKDEDGTVKSAKGKANMTRSEFKIFLKALFNNAQPNENGELEYVDGADNIKISVKDNFFYRDENGTLKLDTLRESIKASEGKIVMSPSSNGSSEIRTYRDQNGKIVRQEGTGRVIMTETNVIQDTQPNVYVDLRNKGNTRTTITTGTFSTSGQGHDDWENLQPGEWSGRIKGSEYCLSFNNSEEGTRWRSYHSTCLPRKEFKATKTSDGSDLEVMTRESGKLELYGYWRDNDRGQGDFKFTPDPNFMDFLSDQGIRLKREQQAFNLFMANINNEYISFLKQSGFQIDGDGITQLAVHEIDLKELKEFIGMFADLNNKDYDLKDLVQFKIHNVTPKYVNQLRGLGMDLNTNNVVQAAIHNVEPEFVKAMMDYGLKEADMQDMIQFSIHNVEIDYLEKMKALGFDDLNTNEIVQLNIHNVDPSYVKKFRDMGYKDMDVNDMVQFAIHNIDPDYINSFKKAGIDNISKNDIVQAGIHKVDVNFVKAMQDAGFQNVDMNDMVQFSIHGVNVDFISGLKAAGLSDLSKNDIVQAKIHGVKPAYIKEFRDLGMGDLDMNDIIQFAIHGIRPSFVKGFKTAGFDDLSKSQIVQAGIHKASPDYIKSIRDLDIEIGDFGDIINAKIHGVSASFINRAKEKGYSPKTLKEFTRLKISGL